MIFRYGDLLVPTTVMWSAEGEYVAANCPVYEKPAICQLERQGEGVPRFGQPHVVRQRRAMKYGLCDLCEGQLHNRTKISLSNFGTDDPPPNCVLSQLEPLLHVECAKICMEYCPALKRQLASGRLRVRQVFRCKPRVERASAEECARFVPDYRGTPLLGEAVMDLLSWRDVTDSWRYLTKES